MISCVKLLVIRELLARREKPKHAGQVTLVSTQLHCTHLVIFWSSFLLIIISSSAQRICLWNKILVASRSSEPSFWVCHDFLLSCSLLLPSSASFLDLSCPLYPPYPPRPVILPIKCLCSTYSTLFAQSRLLYFFHPALPQLNPPLFNSFTPSLSSRVLEGVGGGE